MRDIDDRLAETITSLLRAARTLAPGRFDTLLDDVGVEVMAALMEETACRNARFRGPGSSARGSGTVVRLVVRRSEKQENTSITDL